MDHPDRTPIALTEQGNGPRRRSIEFDQADAYMLARAMVTASGVGLMSGSATGLRRLKYYRDLFLEMAPGAAKLFARDADVAEIVMAMDTEATWSSVRVREYRWNREMRTIIKCGKRQWQSRDQISEEAHNSIIAMLCDLSPLSCTHTSLPDIDRT